MIPIKATPICAYCGKTWPKQSGDYKHIPKEILDEIREHVLSCKKNPLVKQLAEKQKIIEHLMFAGELMIRAENYTHETKVISVNKYIHENGARKYYAAAKELKEKKL
jgi:hypothetical protein